MEKIISFGLDPEMEGKKKLTQLEYEMRYRYLLVRRGCKKKEI